MEQVEKTSDFDSKQIDEIKEKDKSNKINNNELTDISEVYKTIFEESAVAITVTTEDEQIIFWNKYAEFLLKMDKDDLFMKPVRLLYPNEEWEKIRSINVRKKGMQHSIETKIIRKDNELLDVDISITVLKDDTGNIMGSIGIIKDISKRKKIEKKLRLKESAIDSSINAIAITDLKGNITYVNPSFLNLWGYENYEDVIGEPIVKFWKMKGKFVEVMDAVLTKKGWVGELKAERKNNSIFDIQLSATSIKNDENQPISMMASFVDVTRRKRAEEKLHQNAKEMKLSNIELQITQQQLRELNRTLEDKVHKRTNEIENLLKQKDEFIGQLGHDLKTPISVILTLLPMIKDDIKDEDVGKDCCIVRRNVEYIKNLVIETLKFAELSSPNVILEMENLKLNKIICEVVDNLKSNFVTNNIKFKSNVNNDVIVEGNGLRLRELFENLITNAVKYTPEAGGTITIDTKEEKKQITVSIIDTGIGMNEDQKNHIFDEFYKVDESRHEISSAGLGLSICKRIIEKHNGKIWVESSGLGKGSTFHFTLKLGS